MSSIHLFIYTSISRVSFVFVQQIAIDYRDIREHTTRNRLTAVVIILLSKECALGMIASEAITGSGKCADNCYYCMQKKKRKKINGRRQNTESGV